MITASIVVHNSPEAQLSKALKCLSDSEIDKIYVIDNSPNDLLKSVSEKFQKVTYQKVPNKGFGAGHNIAIRQSLKEQASYHLVMNADVYWEGDIIGPLIHYLESNNDVGLVSPKTLYPDGRIQYTCRMLPTPGDLFIKRFLPYKFKKKRMREYLLQDFDHNHPLNCPYLLGSFLLFRNKALQDSGLFDERFFMYPEDIDITRRLQEKWKTMFWPGVIIIHEHQQASTKSMKMFLIHFTNMVKYFNKWGWLIDNKRKLANSRLRNSIKNMC